MTPTSHTITIRNELDQIRGASDRIAQIAEGDGVTLDIIADIKIVMDEILSNIINHGYPDKNPDTILIHMTLTKSEVLLEFVDSGIPFDPTQIPPRRDIPENSKEPVGGLGFHFVRNLMDAIDYSQTNGQNHLALRKSKTLS